MVCGRMLLIHPGRASTEDLPEEETLAWVLVTAIPSYYENNKEHLNNMACSLAPME